MEIDKEDLLECLMLIIDNDNTSASRSGLERRSMNRKLILKELLFMLALTTEEAEDLYWQWWDKGETEIKEAKCTE